MNLSIQYKINTDPNQKRYLRENSYWYKYLNRNPIYYNQFLEEMKNRYKLTTKDKINKTIENIEMISSFLDVLK